MLQRALDRGPVATDTTRSPPVTTHPAPYAEPGSRGLVGRWRARSFGPASERPYRRRTSDWIRLAVATMVLVALSRHAGDLTRTERSVFEAFNTLPSGLRSLFRLVY